jgi:hypothetical protein
MNYLFIHHSQFTIHHSQSMEKQSIFSIWNPTENTLKGFRMLRDALKENALLDSGIYTLRNEVTSEARSMIALFNFKKPLMCRHCQRRGRNNPLAI